MKIDIRYKGSADHEDVTDGIRDAFDEADRIIQELQERVSELERENYALQVHLEDREERITELEEAKQ